MSADLPPELEDWLTQESFTNEILGKEPKGHRDLMWCPYGNEPVIVSYKDNKPTCTMCSNNFEASTHTFLGHIYKPRWSKEDDGK